MNDQNLFTIGLENAKFYGVEFEYSQTFMEVYGQIGNAIEAFMYACTEWDLPIPPEIRELWEEEQAERKEFIENNT